MMPVKNMMGRYTIRMQIVATRIGRVSSVALSWAAVRPSLPISKWRCRFSCTTMLLSSNVPITRANPPSVMMFTLWPVKYSATSAEVSERGIANPTKRGFDAAEEQENHQAGQPSAQQPFLLQVRDCLPDIERLVIDEFDCCAGGNLRQLRQFRAHPVGHFQRVCPFLPRDGNIGGLPTLHPYDRSLNGGESAAVPISRTKIGVPFTTLMGMLLIASTALTRLFE